MLLSRTRKRAKLALKSLLFDAANLQEVTATRHRRALEDCMGFRGQWDEHRRFQLVFLKEHGLLPTSTLLEIGYGPLTDGISIIEFLDPGNYVGIDIRSSAINPAWGEVALAGLGAKNPRLVCTSTFGSEELEAQEFDFVLAFSVLFHLSDEILQAYFEAVARRLVPNGRCFAQINTTMDDSTWLQFPFLRRTAPQYAEAARLAGLHMESLGTLESLGFQLPGEERNNEMLIFTK